MADPLVSDKTVRRPRRTRQPQSAKALSFQAASLSSGGTPLGAAILEEARRNGLLEGGKSAHVSFRVPQALVDAAKQETGIASLSELGTLALAMLAQPDPVAAVMKKTRGRLGPDHKLDY